MGDRASSADIDLKFSFLSLCCKRFIIFLLFHILDGRGCLLKAQQVFSQEVSTTSDRFTNKMDFWENQSRSETGGLLHRKIMDRTVLNTVNTNFRLRKAILNEKENDDIIMSILIKSKDNLEIYKSSLNGEKTCNRDNLRCKTLFTQVFFIL